jgi:transcriptional regulator with XRE-family HTH domain
MQVITAEQIRAARALLNWKQADLARQTGLSLPSINNIERSIGSPRVSTLKTIQNALQAAGVAFLGNNGVQKHSEVFEMVEHQGDDFMRRLNEDLFLCMRGPADEVCMLGIDDRMYVKHAPEESVNYYDHQIKTGFQDRMLFCDDDDFFISRLEACRWIAPQLLGMIPYYVYHDRLAFIMWDTKRTIIIRSRSIADTFRAQFDFLWQMAKPIPPESINKLDDPAYRKNLLEKAKGKDKI